jgi:TonB family protein
MKTVFFLILILLFPASVSAQTGRGSGSDTNAIKLTAEEVKANDEVNRLSANVARLFREKKYDEALKQAQASVATAEAAKLFDKGIAAGALGNLAEIYLVKSKESEAIDLFLRAAATQEKGVGKRASPQVVKYLERAVSAEVKRAVPSFGKARDIYLELLALKEQIYGAQSREVVAALDNLAEVYRYGEKYDEAEQYYQRAVTLSDQLFKPEDKEYGKAFNHYQCFNYQVPGLNLDKKYLQNFQAFAKNRNIKYPLPEPNKTIQGGVVNSRATSLAKPPFPDGARGRYGGTVVVQVTIDENGRVTDAEATCGFQVFAEVSVRAARQSTFTPTMLNGIPVKVTGVIVYNFTP